MSWNTETINVAVALKIASSQTRKGTMVCISVQHTIDADDQQIIKPVSSVKRRRLQIITETIFFKKGSLSLLPLSLLQARLPGDFATAAFRESLD